MCGIAGIMYSNSSDINGIDKMIDSLYHRGPDDRGVWKDHNGKVVLGHRRLSIIDLSQAGHQPMISACGRYVIVFNGEIYNHIKIRKELDSNFTNINWRGHSDTETLLKGIEIWGVKTLLTKCIGMFAFAFYDKKTENLTLARDRIGEKPLYYGWLNDIFCFSSEPKAFRKIEGYNLEVDRKSLYLYLKYGYVPAPNSIYKGIFKLEPGVFITTSKNKNIQYESYWSAYDFVDQNRIALSDQSEEDIINKLDVLLRDAVKQQMMSDVPLGAFLSGGIDSSTVVALMQAQSNLPIKTFSIGFNEGVFNEAQFAKNVANHLNTDHTEMYVSPQHAMDVIPMLPKIYCEPFADSSQIPTYLVSKLAKSKVTVSLSGDAGDELFGGYNRYLFLSNFWQKVKKIPLFLRLIASRGISFFSEEFWNFIFLTVRCFLPKSLSNMHFGRKVRKFSKLLICKDIFQLNDIIISQWQSENKIIETYNDTISDKIIFNEKLKLSDTDKMMLLDLVSYLPDDILVKVDRAAMGVSLESRVPFLDHRVVEFAWSLPFNYKIRNGETKWALRQVLYRYVPKTLIERPKMGFSIPLSDWLRGPLKDWAENLLDEKMINEQGYFNSKMVRLTWQSHLSKKNNFSNEVWSVLMFQAWLKENPI